MIHPIVWLCELYNTIKPNPGCCVCSWRHSCVNSAQQWSLSSPRPCTCQHERGEVKGPTVTDCLWVSLLHICRRLWPSLKNVRVLCRLVLGVCTWTWPHFGKGARSICVPHISHVTAGWSSGGPGRVGSTHLTQPSGNSFFKSTERFIKGDCKRRQWAVSGSTIKAGAWRERYLCTGDIHKTRELCNVLKAAE